MQNVKGIRRFYSQNCHVYEAFCNAICKMLKAFANFILKIAMCMKLFAYRIAKSFIHITMFGMKLVDAFSILHIASQKASYTLKFWE